MAGFNVRPTLRDRQQAEADEVEIRLHSIIYKVIEEIRSGARKRTKTRCAQLSRYDIINTQI